LLDDYPLKIAKILSLNPSQISTTLELLEGGATVPFIARYRKEATGALDEVQILNIRDLAKSLQDFDNRLTAIIKSLKDRELLTEQLQTQLLEAKSLTELEDIYLPFRPKRHTRAMAAREKNLEPLALALWEQSPPTQ
jgi:uncharacterized protein